MHEELNMLFEKLCEELCEYGQKDLTQDSLKTIDTLAHAGKNVLKVMEGCEGGGSYAYYDEDPRTTAMGGSMRGSYNGGGSYGGSYRMSGKRDKHGPVLQSGWRRHVQQRKLCQRLLQGRQQRRGWPEGADVRRTSGDAGRDPEAHQEAR